MIKVEDVRPLAWSDIRVLYDDGSYSIIYGKYEKRWAVGVRWNGEPGTVGHPSARGYPLWHVIPKFLEVPTVEAALLELIKGSGPEEYIEAIRQVLLDLE